MYSEYLCDAQITVSKFRNSKLRANTKDKHTRLPNDEQPTSERASITCLTQREAAHDHPKMASWQRTEDEPSGHASIAHPALSAERPRLRARVELAYETRDDRLGEQEGGNSITRIVISETEMKGERERDVIGRYVYNKAHVPCCALRWLFDADLFVPFFLFSS